MKIQAHPFTQPRSTWPYSLVLVVALLFGLAGGMPSSPAAAQDDDLPEPEQVATQSVAFDADQEDVAWQVTTQAALTDPGTLLPFAPGFLYASGKMLLVYRDADGRFSRLRPGVALGLDGTHEFGPVSFGGAETDFLAIELLTDTNAPDPGSEGLDLPAGPWELRLWRLAWPTGSDTGVTLDPTDDTADGDASPTLVIALDGSFDVATEDGDEPAQLVAEEDDAAQTVSGSVDLRPVEGGDTGDPPAVLLVTIASPGSAVTPTVTALGDEEDRGGVSPSRRSSSSPDASGSAGSSASGRPSPSSSPSDAPSDDDDDDVPDSDHDGMSDPDEIAIGADPANSDSDGDGLTDGIEVGQGTSPMLADSDGDGMDDNTETINGTNPTIADPTGAVDADPDLDSLNNGDEDRYGTDRLNPDSDGDGINDGVEVFTFGTNPDARDTDSDGLSDTDELYTAGTLPRNPDTDGDGILDGQEASHYGNPLSQDTDQDCLSDSLELSIGTYLQRPDSDFDGYPDFQEYGQTNPLDSSDYPDGGMAVCRIV